MPFYFEMVKKVKKVVCFLEKTAIFYSYLDVF